MGQKRRRETDTDAVSFSPNLHKITGLGPHPQRLWEGRRGRGTKRDDRHVRAGMRRAETHWKLKRAERTEDITEHKYSGEMRGPGRQRLLRLSFPRRRCQALGHLLRAGQKDHSWQGWRRWGGGGGGWGQGQTHTSPASLTKEGREKRQRVPGIRAPVSACPHQQQSMRAQWGQCCPPRHTLPTLPHEQLGWERQAGVGTVLARQRHGRGAKTCPRKSGRVLFSLAGGGHRGLHNPPGEKPRPKRGPNDSHESCH